MMGAFMGMMDDMGLGAVSLGGLACAGVAVSGFAVPGVAGQVMTLWSVLVHFLRLEIKIFLKIYF